MFLKSPQVQGIIEGQFLKDYCLKTSSWETVLARLELLGLAYTILNKGKDKTLSSPPNASFPYNNVSKLKNKRRQLNQQGLCSQ